MSKPERGKGFKVFFFEKGGAYIQGTYNWNRKSDSKQNTFCIYWFVTKARFRRRSTHVPNLTDELSTAKERCLNQFGTAVLVWCGKSVLEN